MLDRLIHMWHTDSRPLCWTPGEVFDPLIATKDPKWVTCEKCLERWNAVRIVTPDPAPTTPVSVHDVPEETDLTYPSFFYPHQNAIDVRTKAGEEIGFDEFMKAVRDDLELNYSRQFEYEFKRFIGGTDGKPV